MIPSHPTFFPFFPLKLRVKNFFFFTKNPQEFLLIITYFKFKIIKIIKILQKFFFKSTVKICISFFFFVSFLSESQNFNMLTRFQLLVCLLRYKKFEETFTTLL